MHLRRYNLFYVPNGRGKTTLYSILRSFQTGQPEFIIGRRTLGASGSIEVKLLCNNVDMGMLDGEKWNTFLPAIAIPYRRHVGRSSASSLPYNETKCSDMPFKSCYCCGTGSTLLRLTTTIGAPKQNSNVMRSTQYSAVRNS